jgi:NRPS condensation-like uncharacterized protein
MLCEDSPSHPMCFFLRLKFTGHLDSGLLDAALAQAVARHPLLSSIVKQDGRKRKYWQSFAEKIYSVQWQTVSSDGQPHSAVHIDLENQPGMIVSGYKKQGGDELVFQFHHACCDAIGGLQLIEDVLLAYAKRVDGNHDEGSPVAWRAIDSKQLPLRAKFGLTRWQLLAKLKQQAVGLIGAWQFLMRTPAQLSDANPAASDSAMSSPFPAAYTANITTTVTESWIDQSRASKTTFNNLLICKLLRAISDFRSSRNPSPDRRWLRLSIPVNLRRAGTENLSAANVVSMIFIDRRSEDLADEEKLLRSVHDQTQQIKDLDLGLTFPLSLRLFTSLPGYQKRMQRMRSDPRCRCTAVLSNLVRPLSNTPLSRRDGKLILGDSELTGIEFLPPVRPGTAAAFGVLTYSDQLSIALHYDSHSLTQFEAKELIDGFVAQLQPATNRDVVNVSMA